MIEPLEPRTRLTESEAAEYLGVKPETLRGWRNAGTAPRFTRAGRQVQYRVEWLEDYLDAHVEEPIYWPEAVRQEAPQVLRAA